MCPDNPISVGIYISHLYVSSSACVLVETAVWEGMCADRPRSTFSLKKAVDNYHVQSSGSEGTNSLQDQQMPDR